MSSANVSQIQLLPEAPKEARGLSETVNLGPEQEYLIDGRVLEAKIGCGWEAVNIDVDLSLAVYNAKHEVVDVIWWDKPHSHYVSCTHLLDDRDGTRIDGKEINEEIEIKFGEVPAAVHYILAVLTVYTKGRKLNDVSNIFINLSHEEHELFRFGTKSFDQAGAVLGVFERNGPWWTFKPLGEGVVGRTAKEIVYNMPLEQIIKEPPNAYKEYKVKTWAVEGHNLAASDQPVLGLRTSDCFAEIKFNNKRTVSEVIEKSLEPKWTMPKFELGSTNEADYSVIEFNVWDHDTNSPDDFLGSVLVAIGGICQKGVGTHTFTFDLGPSQDPKIVPERGVEISGTLTVGFEVSELDY